MPVSSELCMLSGRSLCDRPIPRPEESYRVCVSVSVIRRNNNPVHLQRVGRRGQTKKKEEREIQITSSPIRFH